MSTNVSRDQLIAEHERKNAAMLAQKADEVMQKAKLHIQVYHPFFGALLERLKMKPDTRHPSIYTDAVVLGYNPMWVVRAPWSAVLYNIAQLVTHCALRHPFRRGKRNEKLWREATDQAANLMLLGDSELAAMMPSPSDEEYGCGGAEERFRGLASEQIYSLLEAEQPPQQKEEPDPTQEKLAGGTGGAGDCCDAGASGEQPDHDDEEKKDEGDDSSGAQGKHSAEGDQPGAPSDGSGDGTDSQQPGQDAASGGQDELDGDDPEEHGDGEGAGSDPLGDGEEEDTDGGGEQEEGEGEEGEGEGDGEDGDNQGGVTTADEVERESEPLDAAALAQMEREWGEAVMTATLAAGGEMGDGMRRQLGVASEVRKSFEEYIDVFANKVFADQESWKRPNRRFGDAYLPSHSQPSIRKLLAGVDVSGSITDVALGTFQVALERMVEQFGCGVIVAYCDTKIRKVQEFQRGEKLDLEPAGGGGTRFAPIFDYALQLIEEGEEIAGVVYLTDLEGHLGGWQKYTEIETLWVSTEPVSDIFGAPPIGTVCSIHD